MTTQGTWETGPPWCSPWPPVRKSFVPLCKPLATDGSQKPLSFFLSQNSHHFSSSWIPWIWDEKGWLHRGLSWLMGLEDEAHFPPDTFANALQFIKMLEVSMTKVKSRRYAHTAQRHQSLRCLTLSCTLFSDNINTATCSSAARLSATWKRGH